IRKTFWSFLFFGIRPCRLIIRHPSDDLQWRDRLLGVAHGRYTRRSRSKGSINVRRSADTVRAGCLPLGADVLSANLATLLQFGIQAHVLQRNSGAICERLQDILLSP